MLLNTASPSGGNAANGGPELRSPKAGANSTSEGEVQSPKHAQSPKSSPKSVQFGVSFGDGVGDDEDGEKPLTEEERRAQEE